MGEGGQPYRAGAAAPLLLGVLLLGVWAVVAASGRVPVTFLPSPSSVLGRFLGDLGTGVLPGPTLITAAEAALGCLVATVVALPLAYVITHVAPVRAALSPYLAASQALPAVAIAPLLVIWVGYGLLPVVLLCALIVFFPIVLTTSLGLRQVDQEVIEAARLDGASGLTMVRHIEEPLARPAILTGLRNGYTLSITGAVVGELVMGGDGLGTILTAQAAAVDTTGVFATLGMLCLLAAAIHVGMMAVERLCDPHRSPAGR